MKPQDTKIIDGTKPSEGGDITVEHLDGMPIDGVPINTPGATITPTKDTGLKPFNEHFVGDIDKANNYQDLDPIENKTEDNEAVDSQDDSTVTEPVNDGANSVNSSVNQGSAQQDFSQQQAVVAAKGVIEQPSGQPAQTQPSQNIVPAEPTSLAQNLPTAQTTQENYQSPPNQNTPQQQAYGAPMQAGMYSTNPASAGMSMAQPNSNPAMGQTNNGANGIAIKPVVGGEGPANNINGVKPNKNKISKKKLLLIAIPITSILIAAGLVFGLYLPNTPENVWKTGMNRTGQELTALVEKLENPEEIDTYEKAKITMSGEVEQDGETVELNFDSLVSDTKSDSNFNVKTDIKDAENLDLTADVITDLPEGAKFPNIYFKVNGFSQFGLDAFIPKISDYEDKWIAIEQDFINEIDDSLSSAGQESEEQEFKYEDYMSVVKDANSVAQQYIFTADPEFAVIQMNEFVGTEDSEGIKANHYKASVNKENYKKFCSAFINKLAANKVIEQYSGLSGDEYDRENIEAKEDCTKAADEIESGETFDIWMDKNYKLFHKVRIYEKVDTADEDNLIIEARYQECLANSLGQEEQCQYIKEADVDQEVEIGEKYSELGQVYKGGDNFMFFVIDKNESNENVTNARLELNINTSTLAFNGAVTSESKSDYGNTKVNITMASEPYDGDINSAKPSGAIPVQQMLKAITGEENPFATVQANARDSQRQSDISAISKALEVYYVENGVYPSLEQLNDTEFRQTALSDLPEETFVDPGGSADKFSSRVGPNVYSYVVVPANCVGNDRLPCTYYELSAKLEDGSLYTKKSVQ